MTERQEKGGEDVYTKAHISPLAPAAQRALDEAAARRNQAISQQAEKEYRGRAGLDPVRYGDWEIKGLACDF